MWPSSANDGGAENADAPEAAIGLLAANVAMYRGKLAPSRSSRADHSHVPVSVERLIWPLQEYKITDRQALQPVAPRWALVVLWCLLYSSLVVVWDFMACALL